MDNPVNSDIHFQKGEEKDCDSTSAPEQHKSFDWIFRSQLEEEEITNFNYHSIFNSNEEDSDNAEKYLPSDWLNEAQEKHLHAPRKSKKSKSFSAIPPQPNEITQNYINTNTSQFNESVNSYENNNPVSGNFNKKHFTKSIGFIINQFDINDRILPQANNNPNNQNKSHFKSIAENNPDLPLNYNYIQLSQNQIPMGHSVNNSSNQTQGKIQNWDINLILSKCKTHQGSIYLQNLVTGWNASEVNDLLIVWSPYLIEIMCNHYGNYFIQKIFQQWNLNQRLMIFTIIDKQFYYLCTNKSGTYSIQSLIDVINTVQEEQILANLVKPHLWSFFCDENAHHVIQKIIINFPEHKREYINTFILTHWIEVSCNEFASLCLIKFIVMNSNLYIRLEIIKIWKNNFMRWNRSKHAWRVYSFLLERFGVNYCGFIIQEVKSKFLLLLTQASSSEFVGKIITITNKLDRNIVLSLIWCVIQNDTIVAQLLQTSYGVDIIKWLSLLGTQEQRKLIDNKICKWGKATDICAWAKC